MKSLSSCRRSSRITRCRAAWHGGRRDNDPHRRHEQGFTLVELLIVVTVLPLVVGALSYGLLTVLQLQSGVQNRIADTSDSQMVLADFTGDVQSATFVTTQSGTTAQCGAGNQILGLEWGQSSSSPYNFENVVSYVTKQLNGSSNYSLVRQYCTTTATGTAITSAMTYPPSNNNGVGLVSSIILSNDFPQTAAPIVAPTTATTNAVNAGGSWDPTHNWVPASSISTISLGVTESLSNYSYTLVATPETTSSGTATGTPETTSNNTSCGFATAGTGPYANNLCFIDFTSLTGARLAAAENYGTSNGSNCGLEMSSTLPGNFTMYFCLGISGTLDVAPQQLPTYYYAALGNDIYPSAYPFYIGVAGEPALYQTIKENQSTTLSFSNINVVNQQGVAATGWQWFSADAESTDTYESLSWTANSPIYSLGNGFPWDDKTTSDYNLSSAYGNSYNSPIGDACYGGMSFTNNSVVNGVVTSETIKCSGQYPPTNPTYGGSSAASALTGAAMIYGSGSSLQVLMTTTNAGLEGVTFGAMTAGKGS